MVQRVIRHHPKPRAARGAHVLRTRAGRAPRRAPHRRAVRLSAVASAGDGPSPPQVASAANGGHERARCALDGVGLPPARRGLTIEPGGSPDEAPCATSCAAWTSALEEHHADDCNHRTRLHGAERGTR
jgi:hypothetical protein